MTDDTRTSDPDGGADGRTGASELRAALCWAEEEATRLWLKHADANRIELTNVYDGHRRALKALLQREEPGPVVESWMIEWLRTRDVAQVPEILPCFPRQPRDVDYYIATVLSIYADTSLEREDVESAAWGYEIQILGTARPKHGPDPATIGQWRFVAHTKHPKDSGFTPEQYRNLCPLYTSPPRVEPDHGIALMLLREMRNELAEGLSYRTEVPAARWRGLVTDADAILATEGEGDDE